MTLGVINCAHCKLEVEPPFYEALIGYPPTHVRGHKDCVNIMKLIDEKEFQERERGGTVDELAEKLYEAAHVYNMQVMQEIHDKHQNIASLIAQDVVERSYKPWADLPVTAHEAHGQYCKNFFRAMAKVVRVVVE